MAVRHIRKAVNSKSAPQNPATLGAFSGMAQDGPARKTRPIALAEELVTRGCSFVEKGVWDDAEREFRKALKMAPDYPEAYNNLGLSMIYDGRPAEACEALQEALHQFPNWHCAEANLGLACQQLDKHEEAVSFFRQSLNHKLQQPQVSVSLGDSLNALGRPDDALASYQKAIDQIPNYALAHSRMGTIYARRGKMTEAEAALSRAIKLDPFNSEAGALLGAIAARRGNFQQAKERFAQILGDPVPLAAQRGTQRIAQFESAARKAFDEWKSAQPHVKPLANCYFDLGLALIASGDDSEALNMIQRAAQLDTQWADPQMFLAFVAALEGNAILAKNALENAASLEPKNGVVPEQLGYLLLGMGLTKEAEVQFKKAHALGRPLPPDLVHAEN